MCLVTQSCLTLCGPMDCSPPRLLCPWNFPGKNTGVGCHFLFQGIFSTQGWNPCLCVSCTDRQILYHCATWEAPRGKHNGKRPDFSVRKIGFLSSLVTSKLCDLGQTTSLSRSLLSPLKDQRVYLKFLKQGIHGIWGWGAWFFVRPYPTMKGIEFPWPHPPNANRVSTTRPIILKFTINISKCPLSPLHFSRVTFF